MRIHPRIERWEVMGIPPRNLEALLEYYGGPAHHEEFQTLKEKAALAEEVASLYRDLVEEDQAGTFEEDWLFRYDAIGKDLK
jgi:hypothetical protein